MLTGTQWAAGVAPEFEHLFAVLREDAAPWKIGGPTGGLRTDESKQAELYAKGRALLGGVWRVVDPRKVVTNAATLLQTPHGRGAAVDVWAVNAAGRATLPDEHPQWNRLRELVAKANARAGRPTFEWGGAWAANLVDKPHVQLVGWRSRPFDVAPAVSGAGLLVAGVGAWLAWRALRKSNR